MQSMGAEWRPNACPWLLVRSCRDRRVVVFAGQREGFPESVCQANKISCLPMDCVAFVGCQDKPKAFPIKIGGLAMPDSQSPLL